jgi:hypothetical protein
MIENSAKSGGARAVPSQLVAGMWIVAVCAPLLFVLTNAVQASARRDAEDRLLGQVAAAVNSPYIGRDHLLAMVERNARQASDPRFLRVCNRLGIPADWKSLFAEVRRRGVGDQGRAARIIAEECDIAPDADLKREENYLATIGPDGAVQATGPMAAHLLHAEN